MGRQAPVGANCEDTCVWTCGRCARVRLASCSCRAEDEADTVLCLEGRTISGRTISGRTVDHRVAVGRRIAFGQGNHEETALPQTPWRSTTQARLILGKDVYIV